MAALLQRLAIHFFIDRNLEFDIVAVFDPSLSVRAFVLINTTVLLLLSVKILLLYFDNLDDRASKQQDIIEIKSDKRFYKINANEILYLEGLGNYVTYHLRGGNKIISYISLKKALELLPGSFTRIHKSYVVNSSCIYSYNHDSVEILPKLYLPIGNAHKSVIEEFQN